MSKMLVTYASRAGSTSEVARAIAQILESAGAVVDVKPVGGNVDIKGYNAVVIGSAIRMGSWLPEAIEFVSKNQLQLSKLPTAFFTVHMLNRDDSVKSRQAREAYTAPVRLILQPAIEVFFGGMMDYSKLSFIDRVIAKSVAKSTNSAPGDYRDWQAIRAWASNLPKALVPA